MKIVKFVGLLLALPLCVPAYPAGPMLVIRHTDGPDVAHRLDSVRRIAFAGDTLSLVRGLETEKHVLSEIRKIEFVWDPVAAGVEDPAVSADVMRIACLLQNQPNPFTPETRIAFDLPKAGPVVLAVYSSDGRLVRTLLTEQRGAGRHTVSWGGRDDAGRKVASGTHFHQLRAPRVEESRRMILLP